MSLSDPKGGAFSVTPHDTNDLSQRCDSLWVGVGGDVKVDTSLGDTVTFVGVTSGSILPIRCTRVYSTGTTATDIHGLYDQADI